MVSSLVWYPKPARRSGGNSSQLFVDSISLKASGRVIPGEPARSRGPYYQPEPWSETPRIGAALKDALDHADAEEAAFLASAFARHRIPPGDAISRLLTLVNTHPTIVSAMAEMLASIESVPTLRFRPRTHRERSTSGEETRANASLALIKVASAETLSAVLGALSRLNPNSPEQERVASALFSSRFNEAKQRTLIENAKSLTVPRRRGQTQCS